jgi:hypothetical protein
MRALGSKRSENKASAARSNGLKGGAPVRFKLGARVEIKRLDKLRHSTSPVYLMDPNKHAGRIGTVLEIAPHDITWRYRRHVWRRGKWGCFEKTAETREVEMTITYPTAVHVRLDNGSEAWFPRYQVHLAALG